jgi:hypothetical protein
LQSRNLKDAFNSSLTAAHYFREERTQTDETQTQTKHGNDDDAMHNPGTA